MTSATVTFNWFNLLCLLFDVQSGENYNKFGKLKKKNITAYFRALPSLIIIMVGLSQFNSKKLQNTFKSFGNYEYNYEIVSFSFKWGKQFFNKWNQLLAIKH